MPNTDFKVNIEQLLLGYYIKYPRMKELTLEAFGDNQYSNSDSVDIYIDLYDMLSIYGVNIYADRKFTIVSSIINLVAHLREYYRTRHRTFVRIYLVYGDCTSMSHKQFYRTFGDNKKSSMFNYEKTNAFIEDQLKLIQILCAYIYGVYYVRRTCDFSIFAYSNIVTTNNINSPVILLTKSKYAYQVPAILNNVTIFRPKKRSGEDESYYINNNNVLYKFCNKLNNQQALCKLKDIDSSLLSLLMTLTNLPSKKVLSLINTSSGINKIHNLITNGVMLNKYNSDIDYLYNNLNISNKIDPVNFKYRFNAIDLVFQHRIYINTAESKDISHIIDLQDKQAIQDINNKYFIDNPLYLDSL